ncbi:MAG: hypothetical protein LBP98_02740 [Tannerella sp.]|nr:hypothetical protein [Tannerella sp.]
MNRQEIEGNIRCVEAELQNVRSRIDYASANTPPKTLEKWRTEYNNLQARLRDLRNALNRFY